METLIYLMVGLIAGGLSGYLIQTLRNRGLAERTAARHELEKAQNAAKEQTARSELEAAHRERVAMLEGQLRERQNAEQIIEAAKAQMSDTFGATAARALESNSNQFLNTANENFNKTLAEAKGELEKRHTEFAALVKPISEQQEKINPNLRRLQNQIVDRTRTGNPRKP